MKKFLTIMLFVLAVSFAIVGCSGSDSGGMVAVPTSPSNGGGGSEPTGSAVVAFNFNMTNTQQMQAPIAQAKAVSMAPTAAMTHYDLLVALANDVATVNVVFTSTTTADTYAGSTTISGGTGTVTIGSMRIGDYTLQIDALSAGGSILFTKTQSVTITTGTNNITTQLDVASSFPVTFTITGMPASTTGAYNVNVIQTLSNATTAASTVNGAYDSTSGDLVFTADVSLWPNYATKLVYDIPTFGVALSPDPLTIDVLALIAANHVGTAAYQASSTVNVGVVLPGLGGLGMDLFTTAGFISGNGGPAGGMGTRTAGTGIVAITQSGAATDVMLTINLTTVAGQSTPFTYQCSGYAGTFEIGVAQAASPYADWLTTPLTEPCNVGPTTISFTPTTSGAAKLQLRIGAAPAGTTFTFTNGSL